MPSALFKSNKVLDLVLTLLMPSWRRKLTPIWHVISMFPTCTLLKTY